MLTGLFKDARFGPFSNLHRCISLVLVCRFGQCLNWRFSPIYFFFPLACFRASSKAANSRFWFGDPKLCLRGSSKNASIGPPPNLPKRISLVKVYRFWTVLSL